MRLLLRISMLVRPLVEAQRGLDVAHDVRNRAVGPPRVEHGCGEFEPATLTWARSWFPSAGSATESALVGERSTKRFRQILCRQSVMRKRSRRLPPGGSIPSRGRGAMETA